MNGSTSAFIECSCHTEALVVTRWSDETETYLGFWHMGRFGEKYPWKQRLKWAWGMFRRGTPHDDDFILCDEQRAKLLSALLKPGEQWTSFGVSWTSSAGDMDLTVTPDPQP